MRSILFRGKTAEGEWLYGSLCLNPYDDTDVEIVDHSKPFLPREPVLPETVGEYIGFAANGVRVYEGDIISIDGRYPKVVVWNGFQGGFALANINEFLDVDLRRTSYQHPDFRWWMDMREKLRIEGNVWDNDKWKDVRKILETLH